MCDRGLGYVGETARIRRWLVFLPQWVGGADFDAVVRCECLPPLSSRGRQPDPHQEYPSPSHKGAIHAWRLVAGGCAPSKQPRPLLMITPSPLPLPPRTSQPSPHMRPPPCSTIPLPLPHYTIQTTTISYSSRTPHRAEDGGRQA